MTRAFVAARVAWPRARAALAALAAAALIAIACGCGSVATADEAAVPQLGFEDPELNRRYQELIHEIRCPQCRTESIAESNAPIAADLRREVREQMAAGASDDEIVAFLLARYGEFVLYRPRFTPKNYALWFGPAVFLALGGIVFWRVLRVRQAQPLELGDDEDDEA